MKKMDRTVYMHRSVYRWEIFIQKACQIVRQTETQERHTDEIPNALPKTETPTSNCIRPLFWRGIWRSIWMGVNVGRLEINLAILLFKAGYSNSDWVRCFILLGKTD